MGKVPVLTFFIFYWHSKIGGLIKWDILLYKKLYI